MADRKPLHPLAAVGALGFVAGLVAWAWLGDWRWAVSGFGVLLALVVAAAVLDGRRQQ